MSRTVGYLLVRAKVPVKKKQMQNLVTVRESAGTLQFSRRKDTFTDKQGWDAYEIREGLLLEYNSENVIYLITCKKCKKVI